MASNSLGSGKSSVRGWTMVNSQGEVMSDDSRSDSSESSAAEFVNLPLDGSIEASPAAASVDSSSSAQLTDDETSGIPNPSTDMSVVERDGGLGACCQELLNSGSDGKISSGEGPHMMDDMKELDGLPSSVPFGSNSSIPSPVFQDDEEDRALHQSHDSDSDDSDFVQIDEDNMEELEDDLVQHMDNIPHRSPSIDERFHFLGALDGAARVQLPEQLSDEEADFNEDTESSTEDAGDDRIESEQSEVGSVMNTLTDVGDLSAFADIADLPLVVGNVARNYCHRPNNRISTALNVSMIVVTILTMGISIGLIMATDSEIEEWQNAYQTQLKKVSSLEWTVEDMNRLLAESKDKVTAYETVVKSVAKAVKPDDAVFKFFSKFTDMVNAFDLCSNYRGRKPVMDCHALIMTDIQKSLSLFKETGQDDVGDGSSYFNSDMDSSLQRKDEGKILPKESDLFNMEQRQTVQDLERHRERERALHWQNLYLLERRQREWERENDEEEDKRERAQWEREDEEKDRQEREKWEREDKEEDRREREIWEREEAENDRKERERWEREDEEEDQRERERWEKEEAENDRRERMEWEREDEEEDRRERERWEKEREEIDGLQCLKKLMTTNLTFLKEQVRNWNVSAFDDFVNMSVLMSGIAEMKQSVLTSVQQIWDEAEKALNKMGEEKRPYFDAAVMEDYLKQALAALRSQFDDVVNLHDDHFKGNGRQGKGSRGNSGKNEKTAGGAMNEKSAGGNEDYRKDSKKDKVPSGWNKVVGKFFKKTSKSLRKFVRTLGSSWTKMKNTFEEKASHFDPARKMAEEEVAPHLPVWLPGKACHAVLSYRPTLEQAAMVEMGSPCMWDVRDGVHSLILKEICDYRKYGQACNIDTGTAWKLKGDLKEVLERDESLPSNAVLKMHERRNMFRLFRKFWRNWASSKLLLKWDRNWAHCQLQYWSKAFNDVSKRPEDSGRCVRSVNLNAVLGEIENGKVIGERGSDIDVVYEDDAGNLHGEEIETMNDDYEHDHCKAGDVDCGIHRRPSFLDVELLDEKRQSNHSHEGEDATEDDNGNYELTAWYLRRAQYRVELRRAKEKAMWFFDLSDHRDDMRKEHNLEIKSAQWLFDHAIDREAQRKQAQQSDWVFERAHHRRNEFAKKWSQHKDQQWEDVDTDTYGRRQEMDDLSQMEWLLQNHGYKHKKPLKQQQWKEVRQKKGGKFRQVYGKKKGHSTN